MKKARRALIFTAQIGGLRLGKRIKTKAHCGNLQPGDLVFFSDSVDPIGHVGMYIGGGNFVHASTPSTGVRVNSLDESYYKTRFLCGRRII